MNETKQEKAPKGVEMKCDLCWKDFVFPADEDVPTGCPECRIGVLRTFEKAA